MDLEFYSPRLNQNIKDIFRLRENLTNKEDDLYKQLCLLTEITNIPNLLIKIYDINLNQFIWFNNSAKRTFGINSKNPTLCEETYLNHFLDKTCYNFWKCRKMALIKGKTSTYSGIYSIHKNSRQFFLVSNAFILKKDNTNKALQFVEISLIVNRKILNNHQAVKWPNGNLTSNIKINELTLREKQIIPLILKGYSSEKIAGKLYISKHTVQSHRKNIMKKLNIKNIVMLGVIACKAGLV